MTRAIQERIRETDFEPFILALPTIVGCHDLNDLYALMERWMDSTHTFHLPIGELTLDPVAFAAITGVAYADRKCTRLNSSHSGESRMPSSA